jgi:NADPH2:quinone reductase
MHAWLCESLDGPAGLRWRELPTPEPGPGEVRVAIRAASINFPDLLVVQGKYQFRPELPFVPGAEFAGVVEAVGSGAESFALGMPVAVIGSTGGFATHACVKAQQAIPLPLDFPLHDAAAFVFTYGTAHHALMDRAALREGETVLVLGAAGGVGTAAIQVAKAAGATVIAAASTASKCALCLSLGADHAVDYGSADLREALKALTGGRGVDVVMDPVGGPLAEAAFRSIAWRGRHLVVGFAEGRIPALPWNLPLLKGASVVGVFWGDFVRREPEAHRRMLAALTDLHERGRLRPAVGETLPLSRLPEAYSRMAKREILGKLVLIPESVGTSDAREAPSSPAA